MYIGFSLWPLFTFNVLKFSIILTILLILPAYIDGFIQYYSKWESKNWLRLGSGLMAGTGIMSLSAIIGKNLGKYLITFF
jgi:uncharacterized membrane protein